MKKKWEDTPGARLNKNNPLVGQIIQLHWVTLVNLTYFLPQHHLIDYVDRKTTDLRTFFAYLTILASLRKLAYQ